MAFDADQDSIADDEGNLRPEVARALTRSSRADRGSVSREGRGRGGAGPEIVWIAVLAFLTLVGLCNSPNPSQTPRLREHSHRVHTGAESRRAGLQSAFVSGHGVSLREGPGLGYSRLAPLREKAEVTIHDFVDGWWRITIATGQSGWVFGAYLSEDVGPWLGPAVITESVRRGRRYERGMYPGDRVLVEKRTARRSVVVMLPDGRRAELPESAVRFSEGE